MTKRRALLAILASFAVKPFYGQITARMAGKIPMTVELKDISELTISIPGEGDVRFTMHELYLSLKGDK